MNIYCILSALVLYNIIHDLNTIYDTELLSINRHVRVDGHISRVTCNLIVEFTFYSKYNN